MKHAPHRNLRNAKARNALATVGWLHRFLDREIGRKRLSAEGLRVERTPQGLTLSPQDGHQSPPVALWHVPAPEAPPDAKVSPRYLERILAKALNAEITGTAELDIGHVGRNGIAIGKREDQPGPLTVSTRGGEAGVYYGQVEIPGTRSPHGSALWTPSVAGQTLQPRQRLPIKTIAERRQSIVVEVAYRIIITHPTGTPGTDDYQLGKIVTKILQTPSVVVKPYGSEQSEVVASANGITGTARHLLAVITEGGAVRNVPNYGLVTIDLLK